MRDHWHLLLLALVLLALAVTSAWWLPLLLAFARLNSDLIQALEALLAIVLALGGLAAGWLAWKHRAEPAASPTHKVKTQGGPYYEGDIHTGGGDFVAGNQITTEVGNVTNGTVVVGEGNNIQTTYLIDDHHPIVDPTAMRRDYLNALFETVGALQLSGIDPKAASESSSSLSLSAVYTALLTQAREGRKRITGSTGARASLGISTSDEEKRLSALEMLNRQNRLVLLGDPGSGKSTFVNFVALCLAGEALGHEKINLALLTAPLPQDDEENPRGQQEEPRPQPWDHGALLPVRVVLRDFAARGLPVTGQKATAKHLCDFIAAELESGNLLDFAPHLLKELREQGGLLLVDGLDEVPEAEQRRVQIRQAVEDFARGYPRVRILVTSRTYAYQNQEWRLQGFTDTLLAPFSRVQIKAFVDHWYAQIAEVRKLNAGDAQGKAVLLKNAIFASDRLLGLAERPLLLTLMASLHAWRGGTLPEKREQLYADTVDLLLDWWERPKTVRDRRGQVIVQHPSLAEWLKVDREKVRSLLNELAYQVHLAQPELTGTADVSQAVLVDGLMLLTKNPDVNPARLVEYLRDRAGLLLPRGEGVFTFPHRTFQEYLAACYLTDHDYPERVAELACADFNRWREVVLLAGAKAGRGSSFAVWSLVDALCYESAPQEGNGQEWHLWGAHLAAQALVESSGFETISERNRAKVERVRGWLVHILKQSALTARERALVGENLAVLGDPRLEVLTIEEKAFCFAPGGPFQMGDGEAQHEMTLPDYWIGQHPVTNAQFAKFVKVGGYREAHYWSVAQEQGCWTRQGFRGRWDNELRDHPRSYGGSFDLDNHPVVGVTWYEALAFTRWLAEEATASGWLPTGWQVRLPSEAEWEKAARGGLWIPAQPIVCSLADMRVGFAPSFIKNPQPSRVYPWGENFTADQANVGETEIGATSAVGSFVKGTSPYRCQDLAGNVWEWTRSIYRTYPYDDSDGREDLRAGSDDPRVLRGGSWIPNGRSARCAYRSRGAPSYFDIDVGFRVVVCPSSTLNSNPLAH